MRSLSPFWSVWKRLFSALRLRHAGAMVAIACILGALAYACSEDTPEGSIRGTVFVADTNRPLPGVKIYLEPDSTPGHGYGYGDDARESRYTISGQDGHFSLSHVPAGGYYLSGSSRSHTVSQSPLSVEEGGETIAHLPLTRSQKDLEIKV